jgi:hypothetical protein
MLIKKHRTGIVVARLAWLFILVVCLASHLAVYGLEIMSAQTRDSLGSSRNNFSSTEKITLYTKIQNPTRVDRISFGFIILNPSLQEVFTHTGNSIPGNVGTGGSSVTNIPIGQFYSVPGNYKFKTTVTSSKNESVSSEAIFSIYTPMVILTYPADGTPDITDKPLVFRWTSSGASKYKIYVDDDESFYNTLFVSETMDTSYTYPQNPSDPRQRLSAGKQYYWKVEGIDSYGNVVARTPEPFSFSLKESAIGSTAVTSDIVLNGIKLISFIPSASFRAELINRGGRTETNINATLYINGVSYGSQLLNTINPGETRYVDFVLELPKIKPNETLFTSISIDFFDDNINNNLLTKSFLLPEEYFESISAKISGRVTELKGKDPKTGKVVGIEGAKIVYTGEKTGYVITETGGQYKIEKLLPGEYVLKVSCEEYLNPPEKKILLEKGKSYPGIDFELLKFTEEPEKEKVKEKKKEIDAEVLRLDKYWKLLEKHIPANIIMQLEGYVIKDIQGLTDKELNEIVDQLEKNTATVIDIKIK